MKRLISQIGCNIYKDNRKRMDYNAIHEYTTIILIYILHIITFKLTTFKAKPFSMSGKRTENTISENDKDNKRWNG